MIKNKERIQKVFQDGTADFIKCDGKNCFLVNMNESYVRLIHKETFDSVKKYLSFSHTLGNCKYYKMR